MTEADTRNHRLVLPADANHYGTLYAGSLLRFALEAAYASGSRAIGPAANLMLRRVLNVECRRPVPVGTLVELRGAVLQVRQAALVVGVVGMPLVGQTVPWMDALMTFVQVDDQGQPADLPVAVETVSATGPWPPLLTRLEKLAHLRGSTTDWLTGPPAD